MEYRDIANYDYHLPPELIRKRGVEPRDAARLFVYDTAKGTVTHDTFANLAAYLPHRSAVVINETRVVPARLMLHKETGGKIEVFVLVNEMNGPEEDIPVLVDRKCVPGMKLSFPDGSFFDVVSKQENRFFVRLRSKRTLDDLLQAYGSTPIPHYLETGTEKRDEAELRKRYQTVFAESGASVAAPTASLHFTDRVFGSLDAKGIKIVRVGLDVGLGTFAPLREENFDTKTLHRERITVSDKAADDLNFAKDERRPIVAVGTTALRTLESVVGSRHDRMLETIQSSHPSPHHVVRERRAKQGYGSSPSQRDPVGAGRGAGDIHERNQDVCDGNTQEFHPYSGETDIFIFPPHRFGSADILVTNFHLPQSSLMLLVDAFLLDKGSKRNLVSLYEEAIREGYAFYSFGDSMVIL
ncbi:MAG: S-adenosylmethionine:tRNA ribosyltransferase-isomerase [Candidatus Moraniibacteriota bacterium]